MSEIYKSDYAPSLGSIQRDMQAVRESILSGKMSAEDGEAVAKAGHVEVKAAEVDLHARVFAHKVDREGLRPQLGSQAGEPERLASA